MIDRLYAWDKKPEQNFDCSGETTQPKHDQKSQEGSSPGSMQKSSHTYPPRFLSLGRYEAITKYFSTKGSPEQVASGRRSRYAGAVRLVWATTDGPTGAIYFFGRATFAQSESCSSAKRWRESRSDSEAVVLARTTSVSPLQYLGREPTVGFCLMHAFIGKYIVLTRIRKTCNS